MTKRTRTNRRKKATPTKRTGIKVPLEFPRHRTKATPGSAGTFAATPATGSPRPPKPLHHFKHAPWADTPPTEKVRKFADEIFGDFEPSLQKHK